MKIRALGTGSKYAKHPLIPPCFLMYSDDKLTAIGAPKELPYKLQTLGHDLDSLEMIVLLSSRYDQIGALPELAKLQGKKRWLVAPAPVIKRVRAKLEDDLGVFLEDVFEVRSVLKIAIKEEHFSETMIFVENYLSPAIPSYGLKFEAAGIFITGEASFNEDWLFRHMDCDLIAHQAWVRPPVTDIGPRAPTVKELEELPLYLQKKIWIYGYEDSTKELEQPFPMLYLPPLSWVFDSSRRDRVMLKERFIRENSKRQV